MAVVLYARVSTVDQTLVIQEQQARAAGYNLDHVVADHGVSGVRVPLRERLEGRRLFDLLRAGDTLLVRWLDRLGRNYADVTETMRQLIDRGVVIRTVINGLTFDGATTDPMQKAVRDALIGFMAAMAEAQAEVTKEAQRAGIALAKATSKEGGQKIYKGRKPSFTRAQLDVVASLTAQGARITAISKAAGLTRQTVYRVQADPRQAEAALTQWEM